MIYKGKSVKYLLTGSYVTERSKFLKGEKS